MMTMPATGSAHHQPETRSRTIPPSMAIAHVDERQRDPPTDAQFGAGRVGCGWGASEFDAVVDLGVLGDEPGTLVDSELFARTIGIDPEAGPSVALVLSVPKRV